MHKCVGIRVGMLTTSPTLGESGTTGCCLDTTTNWNKNIQSVPQHIVKANQTHISMHNDHCRWIMSHTSECSGFGSAGKFCSHFQSVGNQQKQFFATAKNWFCSKKPGRSSSLGRWDCRTLGFPYPPAGRIHFQSVGNQFFFVFDQQTSLVSLVFVLVFC